jgi:hypothetical protein
LILAGGDRLKGIVVLALILLASMFTTIFATAAIVAATISIPRIGAISNQAQHVQKVNPLGDPIDGNGPPGSL